MAYLIDTNVISEVRKGERANWGVRQFFAKAPTDSLFLPVQVLGEIRAGIAKTARGGKLEQARMYDNWLEMLLFDYADRVIDFDADCAQLWGGLLSHQKKDPHTIDKQIAAMALISDMTVVTRDQADGFKRVPNLKLLNPFGDQP